MPGGQRRVIGGPVFRVRGTGRCTPRKALRSPREGPCARVNGDSRSAIPARPIPAPPWLCSRVRAHKTSSESTPPLREPFCRDSLMSAGSPVPSTHESSAACEVLSYCRRSVLDGHFQMTNSVQEVYQSAVQRGGRRKSLRGGRIPEGGVQEVDARGSHTPQ